MKSPLLAHKRIWNDKKILRIIYSQWYKQIIDDLSAVKGKVLEIGSGSGNFKEFKPDIISSDIERLPFLDMCFDAHKIPFPKASLSNIVMIDVLHHLQNPIIFLGEVSRALKPGGRLLMIEPYPSPFSLFIYKKFHPEPFLFEVDPFIKNLNSKKGPWESNQALPYLLFFKHNRQLNKLLHFKKMKIIKKNKMSYLLYPLSGGFEHQSLIPDWTIPLFLKLETICQPLKSLLAFRCYIVLEKTG